jgi:hypothetical protein
MREKPSIEQKWREQGEAFKQEAAQLPHGRERDELLRMARQLEIASHMNDWLSSPGLVSAAKINSVSEPHRSIIVRVVIALF